MAELGHSTRTAGLITRTFREVSGRHSSWLVATTLISLAVVMGFLVVMGPIQASINRRTGYGLIDLELAGADPRRLLGGEAVPAKTILCVLKRTKMEGTPRDKSTALEKMRVLQYLDVGFTVFYGISFLLLAALIWRFHPGYPATGRWVWLIGLGAPAAILDEFENVCILKMISTGMHGYDSVAGWSLLTTIFSIPKWILFFAAILSLWAIPVSFVCRAVSSTLRRAG